MAWLPCLGALGLFVGCGGTTFETDSGSSSGGAGSGGDVSQTGGDGAGGSASGGASSGGSSATGGVGAGGVSTGGSTSTGGASNTGGSGTGGANACPRVEVACPINGGVEPAVDCAAAEEKFRGALKAAMACNPNSFINECSAREQIIDDCGCSVVVNDNSCDLINEAIVARFQWLGAKGCETGCPMPDGCQLIECAPAASSGYCVPSQSPACQGSP